MVTRKTPTEKQQAQALISQYIGLCRDKYGKEPVVNRFKEKWAFQDVIDSLGYDRAVEVLNFYFATESRDRHGLQTFLYNFDKLHESLEARDADRAKRAILLEETRKRMEQSEPRSTDDQRNL